MRSPTQGISRSKAIQLARPEDNKGGKSFDIYMSMTVGYFLHSVKVNINVIWSCIFVGYERVKKKHICSTEAERPCGEHSGLYQQFFLPFHMASNGKVLPALCKLLISSCYQILLIKRQVAPVLTVWGKMNNC